MGSSGKGRKQSSCLVPACDGGMLESQQEKQKCREANKVHAPVTPCCCCQSVCQRVITLGMLLIKESELSSGARACRRPPAPPGSVFSKPQFFLPPKMKEDRTCFILSSACQS